MIGWRQQQAELFDVGNVFPYSPDPKSYYGQLAAVSDKLFVDDDFAALYHEHKGRPSVAPSLLALALIMQAREQISDDETIRRTACDLDWAVVLRRRAGEPLCAKSTFQMFRAQLMVHDRLVLFLQRSLQEARERKLLTGQALAQAVDTKPIFGRGAVEDTYNLIGHGMTQLLRAIASHVQKPVAKLVARHGLTTLKPGARSIKGAIDIDWSDESARTAALTGLVGDARRLLSVADGSVPAVKRAAAILEQVLLQDIAEAPSGQGDANAGHAQIKKGTARGRIPSVTDQEQRHGRKSASKRFTGHKASVSTDVETCLILAVDVLAGDEADATRLLELTEQAEVNAQAQVTCTIGDCAYGSGATRQEFTDAERELLAKVPAEPDRQMFPKSAFRIELPDEPGASLELTQVTCPAGHLSEMLSPDSDGGATFYFDEHCGGCPLRAQCTTSSQGRSIRIHPQERLIQAARRVQATPDGRAKLRRRLIVENSLARLAALGIGQARYVGRAKTRFQLVMASTVANLRRTWNYAATQPA